MPVYYFVKVPKLPREVAHQTGTVQLVEYSVAEKEAVVKGQTIAVVENWWARMALKALGPGYVSKTFFEPRTHIKEGDPLAIVECDPEDGLRGADSCELEILQRLRQKLE